MKRKIINIVCLGFILMLSACANMPDAKLTYYLPKSTGSITVIQTVSCVNPENPIVKTNVDIKEHYSADTTRKAKPINFSDLGSFYSTGSAMVTLSKDGRLEAFNADSTGAGSDVINALIAFADAIPTGVTESASPSKEDSVKKACDKINELAGTGKENKQLPLSVTLRAGIKFRDNHAQCYPLRISGYPQQVYNDISPVLGSFSCEPISRETKRNKKPIDIGKGYDTEERVITLVKPAMVSIKVKHSFGSGGSETYSGSVKVPQWGTQYYVPIPKPPLFGKNDLKLSLYPTGEIKTLKYGSTSGAKSLNSALTSLGDRLVETDAEKAKALNAEADIIAAQQRLLKCQTTPEECK